MSDIELHRKLLGDGVRNQAFHEALQRCIEPGATRVADIGAGTGFLSLLARRLGARECQLYEYSDAINLAQELARANGIDGLTFVQAHSTQVQRPPKADLVVSETLGNYALEEGLLETLVDARRFLKPGGRLIPARLKQFAAPVISARLQQEIDVWGHVGFDLDLSAARDVALNNLYVKQVLREDLPWHEPARCWDDLDFDPAAAPPPSRRQASVNWTGIDGSTVHGFALWWEATLVEGVTLSTSPWAPRTHWDQIYLPLLEPVALTGDDRLALSLTSDTRPQAGLRLVWECTRSGGRGRRSAQRLDSWRGRLEANA